MPTNSPSTAKIHVEVPLMPPIVLESEFTARAEKMDRRIGKTGRSDQSSAESVRAGFALVDPRSCLAGLEQQTAGWFTTRRLGTAIHNCFK
jgi:hypothetical protein